MCLSADFPNYFCGYVICIINASFTHFYKFIYLSLTHTHTSCISNSSAYIHIIYIDGLCTPVTGAQEFEVSAFKKAKRRNGSSKSSSDPLSVPSLPSSLSQSSHDRQIRSPPYNPSKKRQREDRSDDTHRSNLADEEKVNSELVTALQQKYDQLELKVDQNHQVHDTRLNELEA